jgi:hypothetical protein
MTRHILMMLPLYILNISVMYSTFKNFKAQTEWNQSKKMEFNWMCNFCLRPFPLYLRRIFCDKTS